MLHCDVVPTNKAVLVITAELPWHIGMPELVTIVYVGPAMVFDIAARTFDSILKSPPTVLLVLPRRSVPTAPVPALTISSLSIPIGLRRGRTLPVLS